MAYPTNRTIKTVDLTAYSPSVGATPVAAYVRIPFRCQILQASSVLGGAAPGLGNGVGAGAGAGRAVHFRQIALGGLGRIKGRRGVHGGKLADLDMVRGRGARRQLLVQRCVLRHCRRYREQQKNRNQT